MVFPLVTKLLPNDERLLLFQLLKFRNYWVWWTARCDLEPGSILGMFLIRNLRPGRQLAVASICLKLKIFLLSSWPLIISLEHFSLICLRSVFFAPILWNWKQPALSLIGLLGELECTDRCRAYSLCLRAQHFHRPSEQHQSTVHVSPCSPKRR